MFTASAAKRRAFTLLEVMVAAFLSAIILYVLISVLIPALRHSALGADRVELDQRAALLDARLLRTLKRSVRAGVGTHTTATTFYLTIHPLRSAGADSTQLWESWADAFRWQDGQLLSVRMTIALAQTAVTVPTTPTELDVQLAFQTDPALTSSTDGVREFSLVKGAGSQVDYEFVLEKAKESIVWHRTVFLPNSTQ